eukprot:TRINITY_DN5379_c0_g1_i1.p1 TRINITY_DN5379_c0_g1~~TRINITY_DN5379_c0_g1_i1.p1  ORF type:complete len:450 (-),score=52.55 TRINITY_DN5379_c0_g1_i1:19-1368(-)
MDSAGGHLRADGVSSPSTAEIRKSKRIMVSYGDYIYVSGLYKDNSQTFSSIVKRFHTQERNAVGSNFVCSIEHETITAMCVWPPERPGGDLYIYVSSYSISNPLVTTIRWWNVNHPADDHGEFDGHQIEVRNLKYHNNLLWGVVAREVKGWDRYGKCVVDIKGSFPLDLSLQIWGNKLYGCGFGIIGWTSTGSEWTRSWNERKLNVTTIWKGYLVAADNTLTTAKKGKQGASLYPGLIYIFSKPGKCVKELNTGLRKREWEQIYSYGNYLVARDSVEVHIWKWIDYANVTEKAKFEDLLFEQRKNRRMSKRQIRKEVDLRTSKDMNQKNLLKFELLRTELVYNGKDEFTVYVVHVSGLELDVVVKRRYNELLELHNLLKKVFREEILPKFPGKKFLGSKKAHYVEHRANKFQIYFAQLTKREEVARSEVIREWVAKEEDCKKKYTTSKK